MNASTPHSNYTFSREIIPYEDKCLFLTIYVKGRASNAKYSVSFCLPFLSGTLPPPELLNLEKDNLLNFSHKKKKKSETCVLTPLNRAKKIGQKKYGK